MLRHNDLNAWSMFLVILECGSLSSAAKKLNIAPSALSRTMAELENSVGARLFNRNRNQAFLTSKGQQARKYAENLVRTHARLLELIGEDCTKPSGVVRLGIPEGCFNHLLLDGFINLKESFRNIQLEVYDHKELPPVVFRNQDRVLDIIIGYGYTPKPTNENEIVLGECLYSPMVSIDYVRLHGVPTSLETCEKHTLLMLEKRIVQRDAFYGDATEKKIFSHFGRIISYPTSSIFSFSLMAGNGIAYGAQVLYYQKEIATGKLILLRRLWKFPRRYFYLYPNPQSCNLVRVKTVIEFLISYLQMRLSVAKNVYENIETIPYAF